MAKPTQPNKPTDNLEDRLQNLPPDGPTTTDTETTSTEGLEKIESLVSELAAIKEELGNVRAERNDLKLIISELEADKEALNGQIDELEKLGTSRGDSLKIRQASDAKKPSDIELKDNRIYIPGVGTIERADITELHIVALCEFCAKENGTDPEATVNKYFRLKVKES